MRGRTISLTGKGFTMVELIAAIAIVAILVAVMVPAIGNFVSTSRQTADKQTLHVLNDALNRYKMQGGDVAALTAGKPYSNLLSLLKTPISWNGKISHQFLSARGPYDDGITVAATGSGKAYRLTGFNNYIDAGSGSSSELPFGGDSDLGAIEWLAWYDFNDDAPWVDATGNGHDGTPSATNPPYVSGGKAIFDGSGWPDFPYVDISGNYGLTGSMEALVVVRFDGYQHAVRPKLITIANSINIFYEFDYGWDTVWVRMTDPLLGSLGDGPPDAGDNIICFAIGPTASELWLNGVSQESVSGVPEIVAGNTRLGYELGAVEGSFGPLFRGNISWIGIARASPADITNEFLAKLPTITTYSESLAP